VLDAPLFSKVSRRRALTLESAAAPEQLTGVLVEPIVAEPDVNE